MKNTIIIILCLLFAANISYGQVFNNKIRFKYFISVEKEKEIKDKGYKIVDKTNNPVSICSTGLKNFLRKNVITEKGDVLSSKNGIKTKISYRDGKLTLDDIKLKNKGKSFGCNNNSAYVNDNTKVPLTIDLNKTTVKEEAESKLVRLPYDAILLSFYSINMKFKPSVLDSNGKETGSTMTTSSFSLGLSLGYTRGITAFSHRSAASYSITTSLGFGFSSAKLKDEPIRQKGVDLSNAGNKLILSPNASITFARNDIGIIFAYGFDYMMGEYADAWAYQGVYFFGIGITAGLKL